MAHISAHRVHTMSAILKFISPVLERYQAGIIATSLGNGKNDDSSTIMRNIPVYHISHTRLTMKLIISCILVFVVILLKQRSFYWNIQKNLILFYEKIPYIKSFFIIRDFVKEYIENMSLLFVNRLCYNFYILLFILKYCIL